MSPKKREQILKAATQVLSESVFERKRILIVDDDPVFRKRISVEAKRQQIPVTVCGTLEELKSIEDRDQFSAALIDYYLHEMFNGADLASIMGPTPVVIMSGTEEEALAENSIWPPSVRRFIDKKVGFKTLLETAQRVVQS